MSKRIKSKINLITMRMSNHATHSGYDRLIDFVTANKLFGSSNNSFISKVLAKSFKSYIGKSDLKWYNRLSITEEFNAAFAWLTNRNQVFHFLYGENSYRYLGNLKSINTKNTIICTFHTPPERFQEVVRTNIHLNKVDAIITVSRMQMEFFSQYTGKDRTFFVPHGIDVDYFKPRTLPLISDGPVKCLFVGNHMRDVETLIRAGNLLYEWGENCEIVAVTAAIHQEAIEKSKSISIRMNVGDEDLLKLYQESDMLMLPLLDATANNTILEALACGLPIVSTELEGVKDYVNEECALLVKKHDAKELAHAALKLAKDASLRKKMGSASRRRSLEFSWEVIAERMNEIYELVRK